MSDKKDDNDFLDNFTDNYISMRENDNDIENDWIYYFSIGYKITRDNNETFSENKKESDENDKDVYSNNSINYYDINKRNKNETGCISWIIIIMFFIMFLIILYANR